MAKRLRFNPSGKITTTDGTIVPKKVLQKLFLQSLTIDAKAIMTALATGLKDQFGRANIGNYENHPMYPIILDEMLTSLGYDVMITEVLMLAEQQLKEDQASDAFDEQRDTLCELLMASRATPQS